MEKGLVASFGEVLSSLQGAPEFGSSYGPSQPVSGAASQPRAEPAYMPSDAVSKMYASNVESYGEPAVAVAVEARPARPVPSIFKPSTKPESIARELRLRPHHSIDELLTIRRKFALRNHPDRVAPDARDVATIRMSIANRLIDDAVEARSLAHTA